MNIWGDLVGSQEDRTENLLSGQQQDAMTKMGASANRLSEMGNNSKAIDVRDTGYDKRFADLQSGMNAGMRRNVGDVMHTNKIHNSSTKLKQAGVQQDNNFSLASMQQQQMEQQLRAEERSQTANEYTKRQYYNQANQLRSTIANANTQRNLIEDKPGIFNNIMSTANTGAQLYKTFGGK